MVWSFNFMFTNIYFTVALHQALPFIGFGFLDNLIMIIAVSINSCLSFGISLKLHKFVFCHFKVLSVDGLQFFWEKECKNYLTLLFWRSLWWFESCLQNWTPETTDNCWMRLTGVASTYLFMVSSFLWSLKLLRSFCCL